MSALIQQCKRAQVDGLLKSIERAFIYFDTVCSWLPRHLSKNERKTLNSLCLGGLNYHKPARFFRIRTNGKSWAPAVDVQLNQPTQAALIFLQNICLHDVIPRLYRVDVALDLVTRTARTAKECRDYIFLRLKKNWARPEHEFGIAGDDDNHTLYIGRRKDRFVYVGYADHPNKITSARYCCHVEVRMTGHQALRARSLVTPIDLLHFEAGAFLRNKIRLYEIDRKKLGHVLRRRHGNAKQKHQTLRFHYDRDLACANVYLQYLWYRECDKRLWDRHWRTTPPISQLSAIWKKDQRQLGRCLVEVDSEPLLRKACVSWPAAPSARGDYSVKIA